MRQVVNLAILLLMAFSGFLVALDLYILTGMAYPNYKDPTHTKSVRDALMSSDWAPLLHLAIFGLCVLMLLRRAKSPLARENDPQA